MPTADKTEIDETEIDRQLSAFEARNTPAGLLERYAAGRIRGIGERLVLLLAGAAGLALLVAPALGLAAGLLALLGEGVELLYLRRVRARLARGEPLARIRAVSTLTAAVQAATISAAAIIAWLGTPSHLGSGFALAFLLGAAMNAGVLVPFHRAAARARLAVFGITLPALLASDFLRDDVSLQATVFDALAALLLAYVGHVFVAHAIAGHHGRTERKRALLLQGQALARANADLIAQQREVRNLALVAQHASDSVIISDRERRIIWVNQAFTRITGYSLDEARGCRPADLLNARETSQEESAAISRAVAEGRPYRTQILNRTKDGRHIWLGTNIVPVHGPDDAVEVVIAIERDITESKAHEAEMEQARKAAEENEKAKAQFLAVMSHEIRTPMNAIIGMADLLSDADLSRENRKYAETIRRSGEALLRIINDVLDYSKLKSGKPATHAEDFGLRSLIDEVVALLCPEARRKGLYLDVIAGDPLPDRVHGDDGRLRQILINIIGNAIKFTTEGGVTVTLGCRAEAGGHRFVASIRDTGIGIAPDRLDHVFEEFIQADDGATTRQFGGTGLGLSISRLLAREMGGDITVASAPGEGAEFTVSLFFGKAGDLPDAVAPPGAAGEDALAGKTVLVAEDNCTNRLLVKKYLSDLPLTLLFAGDGKQAVEMVRSHGPDIVLMDMSMPEMDGLTATRAIRRSGSAQPRIIALTANAFASDKAACLSAGMDGFLTKPLRKSELMRVLARSEPSPPAPV